MPLPVLLPAFMLSELKVAFLIGFQIYLPFLILDLVVSSVTISMGMMMLPPVMISLPLKLLLFVLVDGWTLVVGMLLESFGGRLTAKPTIAGRCLHSLTPTPDSRLPIMDAQDAINLTQQAMLTALLIGAPILLVGVLVGLLIGLAQALTQVQDQTVAFVPKIVAMVAVLVLCLPWLVQKMVEYSEVLITNIPKTIAGG